MLEEGEYTLFDETGTVSGTISRFQGLKFIA